MVILMVLSYCVTGNHHKTEVEKKETEMKNSNPDTFLLFYTVLRQKSNDLSIKISLMRHGVLSKFMLEVGKGIE